MDRRVTPNRIVAVAILVCLAAFFATWSGDANPPAFAAEDGNQDAASRISPEDELRSLLQEKLALLRESIALLKQQAVLGLATSSLPDVALLMKERVLVELELSQTREERLQICERNVKELEQLMKHAEAALRAGMTPRSALVELKIHRLDAQIHLTREKMDSDDQCH